MFADRITEVIETRAQRPEQVAEAARSRRRSPSFEKNGNRE